MKQPLRSPICAALLLVILLPASRSMAQEQAPAQGTATCGQVAPQRAPDGSFITPKTANTQNLAKAEQEDEEYVFRHSASVRAFGKLFHLSPEAASIAFWLLNFLILAGVLGFFLIKALPKAFRNRRQLIEKQLLEAHAATEDANQRLRAVEDRLSRLDVEIAAVRESAERDSVHDEERIKASLEEERRKIVASAESEIASAGAAAERRLRHFAAELAVQRATARIHLTEEDDRALIREFAADIDGRNGEGR